MFLLLGWVHRELAKTTPNVAFTPYVVDNIAELWDVDEEILKEKLATRNMALHRSRPSSLVRSSDTVQRRRLKVGVISSDYGVHPVSSLIRGVLEYINQEEIELYCFALTDKISWWGHNITGVVEHFIKLIGINLEEAAVKIAETGVEILIDLNGHTLNSGIPIMRHRPAPIQISFLGLPTTTGGWFMDYYLGDPVALPAELKDHFSEKLLLMPPCYIASDYAQLLGGVLQMRDEKRWHRRELKADRELESVSLLFGTFSNTQKFDPSIMHVWMNILSSYPDSKMFFVEHVGTTPAKIHIRNISMIRGVDPDRLAFAKHRPWIHHIQSKTAIDLLLDTTSKNGHTTGLDAVFSGIPMISMAGGATMPARAAESIAAGLESDTGMAFSLKEYEDIALNFARNHRKLMIWREKVERLRTTSTLFDTKRWTSYFTRLLLGTWEMAHVARDIGPFMEDGTPVKYNVFHVPAFGAPRELDVEHVPEPTVDQVIFQNEHRIRLEALGGAGRRSENKLKRFIPDASTYTIPRGGIGQAGPGPVPEEPDPNVASSLYGQPTPKEFYERNAHRKYVCSHKEKKEYSSCKDRRYVDDDSMRYMHKGTQSKSNAEVCDGLFCPNAESRSDTDSSFDTPVPREIFRRSPLVLNIGGISAVQEWVTVNSQASSYQLPVGHVDIIRRMHDLKGFPDNSVDVLYSSHTLEHNGYGDFLIQTLVEWNRVLKMGGMMLVSVPDLKTLARMYLDESLSMQDRWRVTSMIYGGQSDKFDYHKVGFDEGILSDLLRQSGFCDVMRVGKYNLIEDTSEMSFQGYFISLNLVAKKCLAMPSNSSFEDPSIYIPPLVHVNFNYDEYEIYL